MAPAEAAAPDASASTVVDAPALVLDVAAPTASDAAAPAVFDASAAAPVAPPRDPLAPHDEDTLVITSLTLPDDAPPGDAAEVPGVPALLFTPTSEDDRASARAKNAAGLTHLKARDPIAAAADFRAALAVQPSHIRARYNLACALARGGDEAHALALLRQLAAARCRTCLEAVAGARRDPDLRALWRGPERRAATDLVAAAAADLAAGRVARTTATLVTPTRVRWVANGDGFRFGDRLTLTWAKPAELTVAWYFIGPDEPLGSEVALVLPREATSIAFNSERWNRSWLPVSTASQTVTLVARPGEPYEGQAWRAMEIELAGLPSDEPAEVVAAVEEAPDAWGVAWSDGAEAPEVRGLPAVSADGRYVVGLDASYDGSEASSMTLRVRATADDHVVYSVTLRDEHEHEAVADETQRHALLAREKARVVATNAALARFARAWTPMQSTTAQGAFTDWRDLTLTIVDRDARRLHESRHPDWAPPRVHSNPDDMTEGLEALLGGVYLDQARGVIAVEIYYHPGVCPGGGYTTMHAIRAK